MNSPFKLGFFIRWYPLLLVALPLFTLLVIYLSYTTSKQTQQLAVDSATEVANDVSATMYRRSLIVTQNQLTDVAANTALKFKSRIENALGVSSTLAHVLSGMTDAGIAVDVGRDSVNSVLRRLLEQNPQFFAAYTIWEEDAFDMLDLAFANSPGHDTSGRFIPYWYRDDQHQLRLVPARFYSEGEPLSDGQWRGRYYQSVKEELVPQLLAPWDRSIEDQSVRVLSIAVPIMTEGRFVGIAGIDIRADVFQELLDETADGLPLSPAQLMLMTDQGLVSGLSNNPLAIGQMATLHVPGQLSWSEALEQGGQALAFDETHLNILQIVDFQGKVSDWGVYLTLPRNAVEEGAEKLRQKMMADVEDVESRLAKRGESGLWQQLVIMVGVFLLVILILRLVKSLINKEQALRQSEGRLYALMDNATAVIYMKDLEGRYLLVNQRWLELFHVRMEQVIGRTDHELFDESIADDFRANDIKAYQQQKAIEIEEQAPQDDGLHTYISLKFPLFDATGQCYATCGVSTDITERKLAEEAIQQLNAELEMRVTERTKELSKSLTSLKSAQAQLVQSEKMAALGDLVGGIAHEVNTPLGNALTAASSLQESTCDLKKVYQAQQMKRSDLEGFIEHNHESTDILMTNLRRAVELVENFKEVSVDQSHVDLRAFEVRSYLDKVLQSLRPKIKHTRHQLQVEGEQDIEVTLYPGAFAQIITNLVMNSLIHGFDGIEEGVIRIDLETRGDHLRILYQDNGVGIPAEILDRVFEPFVTSKRSAGGSGLGMNIVYNLVTRTMQGSVACSSRKGEGVEVEIILPLKLDLAS
ncbi:MAG: ATP-binding protein [Motiliproteus sp.]|nr:ATP-binding protein [Motiliproteus sp.]MCW9053189.1 ATP-binding protein [Motiliproteus sp.]